MSTGRLYTLVLTKNDNIHALGYSLCNGFGFGNTFVSANVYLALCSSFFGISSLNYLKWSIISLVIRKGNKVTEKFIEHLLYSYLLFVSQN